MIIIHRLISRFRSSVIHAVVSDLAKNIVVTAAFAQDRPPKSLINYFSEI